MDWRAQARCGDADPELFFPVSEVGASAKQVDDAKRVCAGCPVTAECLAEAGDFGIWGGLTASERRALVRR